MMDAALSPYRKLRHAVGRLVPNRRRIWRSAGIEVVYRLGLDGGGTMAAEHFVRFIKTSNGRWPAKFERAFEWCSGPGFIGLTLLGEGVCDHLCLGDLN